MKINGIIPSKVISIYSDHKKVADKNSTIGKKDSLEISSEGRNLSSYAIDNKFENSAQKVENVKIQINQGTYKPNSKAIANKMIDIMKGKEE